LTPTFGAPPALRNCGTSVLTGNPQLIATDGGVLSDAATPVITSTSALSQTTTNPIRDSPLEIVNPRRPNGTSAREMQPDYRRFVGDTGRRRRFSRLRRGGDASAEGPPRAEAIS